MTNRQGFVVAIGIALAIALYFLRNIPEQRTALDELFEAGRDSLSQTEMDRLQQLENLDKPARFDSLTDFWREAGNPALAALSVQNKAKMTGEKEHYTDCGSAMLDAMDYGRQHEMDQNLLHYFVLSAEGCYQEVLAMDSTDMEARLGMADVAIDGKGQIMVGVRQLLDIVQEDSLNIQANLRLGRLSMVNGEYQNAIRRMKHVLQADSANVEAHLVLSNAFNAMGQTDEARYYLEKALPFIEDSELRQEIETRLKKT